MCFAEARAICPPMGKFQGGLGALRQRSEIRKKTKNIEVVTRKFGKCLVDSRNFLSYSIP